MEKMLVISQIKVKSDCELLFGTDRLSDLNRNKEKEKRQ